MNKPSASWTVKDYTILLKWKLPDVEEIPILKANLKQKWEEIEDENAPDDVFISVDDIHDIFVETIPPLNYNHIDQ